MEVAAGRFGESSLMYRKAIFPLLKRVDAERAHERTLFWLSLAQQLSIGRLLLRQIAGRLPQTRVQVCGLTFPNVLGVAAGFDKDVRVAQGLALLGFGHIETGTLTPRPQVGNPKPRLFRLPTDQALINRMGFPNGGVMDAVPRLSQLADIDRQFVLGVSMGKQKETPLVEAFTDYIAIMQAVYPFADYLAVNISSPNTPGLRQLQGRTYLDDLLGRLQYENQILGQQHQIAQRPLLVKISPDLTWLELDTILSVVQNHRASGIIVANTTLSRVGLKDPARTQSGGLSGSPMRQRSTELIAYISRQVAGELPIIGVGGVSNADDVREKIEAGASLVQLYTGMVYKGPGIAGRILRALAAS
jgi:dihydroorotate dehydrogenase